MSNPTSEVSSAALVTSGLEIFAQRKKAKKEIEAFLEIIDSVLISRAELSRDDLQQFQEVDCGSYPSGRFTWNVHQRRITLFVYGPGESAQLQFLWSLVGSRSTTLSDIPAGLILPIRDSLYKLLHELRVSITGFEQAYLEYVSEESRSPEQSRS